MTSTVIVVAGKADSGKSTLLQRLFDKQTPIAKWRLEKKIIDGKLIYAVGDTSPQEQNEFCNVEAVWKDIEKRLDKCELDANGQDFILLLPFTIKRERQNGRLEPNTNCIKEPTERLKRNYKTLVVYLRKLDYADLMMREFAGKEIQSVINEEQRQINELSDIILKI